MTRGDLPWRVLGRPVKPLALAQTMALFVVGWAFVVDDLEPGADLIIGDLTGAWAFVGVALLVVAWARGSQRLAELGLLVAVGVWVARAATVALTGYYDDPVAFWLSICWATAAGGAFLLESTDGGVDGIWTQHSHKPSRR